MGRKKRNEEDVDVMDADAAAVLTPPQEEEKARKPKPARRTIAAEYRLTEGELLTISDELAEAHEELDQLEEQKKNLQDQKKNEIAVVEARINELVRKIRSKVETREFFCEAELDFELKIKRWRDVKTSEVVKTEELSAQDYQQRLRFEEGVDNGTDGSNADDGIWPEDDENGDDEEIRDGKEEQSEEDE